MEMWRGRRVYRTQRQWYNRAEPMASVRCNHCGHLYGISVIERHEAAERKWESTLTRHVPYSGCNGLAQHYAAKRKGLHP